MKVGQLETSHAGPCSPTLGSERGRGPWTAGFLPSSDWFCVREGPGPCAWELVMWCRDCLKPLSYSPGNGSNH